MLYAEKKKILDLKYCGNLKTRRTVNAWKADFRYSCPVGSWGQKGERQYIRRENDLSFLLMAFFSYLTSNNI